MTMRNLLQIEEAKVACDREGDRKRRLGIPGERETNRVAFGPAFIPGDRLKNIGRDVLPVSDDEDLFLCEKPV